MPRRSATPGVFMFRRGHRWVGRWTDPATGRRRDVTLETVGIKNAEDRREWARRKSAEIQQRKRDLALGRHAGQTTFADAIRALASAMVAHGKRPSTVYDYRRAAQSLGDWLLGRGVRYVEETTPRDLARYRDLAIKTKAAPATINGHLRCVRVALGWWRKAHLLPQVSPEEITNTCEQIAQDDAPPVPLTVPQIRQLVARAATAAPREWRFSAAVVVGLLTGMRCGELERLARNQVDLDAPPGGIITLDAATKTRRGRVIDLVVCPAARDVLRMILDHDAEPYVLGRHKVLDRAVMKRWIHQNQFAGFEWSWQRLRQTCESFLVCAPGIGWGVYRAAKQIGHTVQVAETYYLESVRGIPHEARTLEAAMQAEAEFAAAVAAIRGALHG